MPLPPSGGSAITTGCFAVASNGKLHHLQGGAVCPNQDSRRFHPEHLIPATATSSLAFLTCWSEHAALQRAVNGILTASYWEIGRRLVEFEQGGQARAEYGEALLKRLAQDLTAQHGRGFGVVNLSLMRRVFSSLAP